MRTCYVAAITAAVALLLGACGTHQAAPKKSAPPPSDRFLDALVDHPVHSWDDDGPTQTELLAYPPEWCAALDEGHSVKWLFSSGGGGLYPIGTDWGTEKTDANKVLVHGVTAYCPEHRGRVVKELRDDGEY